MYLPECNDAFLSREDESLFSKPPGCDSEGGVSFDRFCFLLMDVSHCSASRSMLCGFALAVTGASEKSILFDRLPCLNYPRPCSSDDNSLLTPLPYLLAVFLCG